MTRQRDTRPPLDERRLGFLSTEGQQPLHFAGDGMLVRMPDGTLGVVATCGQATKQLHVLTEQGTVRVDGDHLVQIRASPVLAAKLLIHLAQTDGAYLLQRLGRAGRRSSAHLPPSRSRRNGGRGSGAAFPHAQRVSQPFRTYAEQVLIRQG